MLGCSKGQPQATQRILPAVRAEASFSLAQQVPPLTCPLKFGAVPRYRVRNFLVSAAIPTGLDCAGLCWTGPLALMGIMCSGLRVEATPLTVPKRLHSLHPHGTATHVERSLQALSQDVPEHERCEND